MKWDEIEKELEVVRDFGNYVSICCPVHDDAKASMLVYKDGWFNCLACGAKGDFLSLQRYLSGWAAPKVAHKQTTSFTPPAPTNIAETDTTRGALSKAEAWCYSSHLALKAYRESVGWYLRMRGLDNRIEPQVLGWRDGWYTVPTYDINHRFQGYVARADSHIQYATGQRFYSPYAGRMYVPDWNLIKSNSYLFVVFGIFDALTLTELRFPVVTGTVGKQFKAEWLDDQRVKCIVIPDKGEEKEGLALAQKLGWRGVLGHINYPDNCKDPNDFLRTGRANDLATQLVSMIGRA